MPQEQQSNLRNELLKISYEKGLLAIVGILGIVFLQARLESYKDQLQRNQVFYSQRMEDCSLIMQAVAELDLNYGKNSAFYLSFEKKNPEKAKECRERFRGSHIGYIDKLSVLVSSKSHLISPVLKEELENYMTIHMALCRDDFEFHKYREFANDAYIELSASINCEVQGSPRKAVRKVNYGKFSIDTSSDIQFNTAYGNWMSQKNTKN
jgi:hypothetical protein